MRNLTNQFIEISTNSEQFRKRRDAYERLMKTNEFSFFKDVLLMIRGTILTRMLSYEFTNLDEKEKDVQQRTYYNLNEIINFLMTPTDWVKRKHSLLSHADLMTRLRKARSLGKEK